VKEKVKEAVDSGDAESLIGYEFSNQDEVRLVPDILQNGNNYFFPVFSSVEDMEVLYVEPEDYFPKEIREKYFSGTDEEDDE